MYANLLYVCRNFNEIKPETAWHGVNEIERGGPVSGAPQVYEVNNRTPGRAKALSHFSLNNHGPVEGSL